MSAEVDPAHPEAPVHPGADGTEATVEEVVRHQLSTALGGVRGMLEAAVPTVVFTVLFLTTHDLRRAIWLAVGAAAVLLVIRLVQRSSVQFVINALVGIGIGAFFAWRSARGGGSESDQALAYFLPGILINAGQALLFILSILTRWPAVGFMVGSVTGEPTGWRSDPQMVKLCSRLTWAMTAPLVVRAGVLGALYLAGTSGAIEPTKAVAILGVTKLALGWPLLVLTLFAIVWLLARNRTPVEPAAEAGTG